MLQNNFEEEIFKYFTKEFFLQEQSIQERASEKEQIKNNLQLFIFLYESLFVFKKTMHRYLNVQIRIHDPRM